MDQQSNKAHKLRVAAISALALGIIGVVIICWVTMHSDPSSDDTALTSDYKRPALEAERMYGKPALVMERISRALKQPGVQVIIIMISAVSVAGGCWRLAKRMEGN